MARRKWNGAELIVEGGYVEPTKAKLNHTPVRAAIWDKTGGCCWYCGLQTNPWRNFCIDHVVPEVKDGPFHIDNLVPCCRGCNVRKGGGSIEELRASHARSANQPTYTFYFETIQAGREWAESFLNNLPARA